MEAIGSVVYDIAAVSAGGLNGVPPDAQAQTTQFDVASFESAWQEAGRGESLGNTVDGAANERSLAAERSALQDAMQPLMNLNDRASGLNAEAMQALQSKNELTPGDLIQLTMQSQQFMFHSQLTSNLANKTSQGIQQLFRQQG